MSEITKKQSKKDEMYAILELTTKFRDTGGQSKSVQSGSDTLGKDTGTTSQRQRQQTKRGVDNSNPLLVTREVNSVYT